MKDIRRGQLPCVWREKRGERGSGTAGRSDRKELYPQRPEGRHLLPVLCGGRAGTLKKSHNPYHFTHFVLKEANKIISFSRWKY